MANDMLSNVAHFQRQKESVCVCVHLQSCLVQTEESSYILHTVEPDDVTLEEGGRI